MPKKRVKISYGRTIQSAPFESIRLDVSIEKDIEDDDNILQEVDKSVDGLKMYVKNKIKQTLDAE